MAQVASRVEAVAHPLLEGLHVGKAVVALALPDAVIVDPDLEDAAGAGTHGTRRLHPMPAALSDAGSRSPVLARVVGAIAAMMMAVCLSGCGAINRVPTLEEQAKSSWSEVQNQYQRRADLIPNLVETV